MTRTWCVYLLPSLVCNRLTPLITIGHDPAHPLQAQGQTFLNRYRGFHTVAAIAIPHTQAQRDAAIPADTKTEQDLFEIVPPVFTMAVSRPRRPWGLG